MDYDPRINWYQVYKYYSPATQLNTKLETTFKKLYIENVKSYNTGFCIEVSTKSSNKSKLIYIKFTGKILTFDLKNKTSVLCANGDRIILETNRKIKLYHITQSDELQFVAEYHDDISQIKASEQGTFYALLYDEIINLDSNNSIVIEKNMCIRTFFITANYFIIDTFNDVYFYTLDGSLVKKLEVNIPLMNANDNYMLFSAFDLISDVHSIYNIETLKEVIKIDSEAWTYYTLLSNDQILIKSSSMLSFNSIHDSQLIESLSLYLDNLGSGIELDECLGLDKSISVNTIIYASTNKRYILIIEGCGSQFEVELMSF